MSERLYIGIDLGTFQSTIATSKGDIHTIETVVGTPKDPVARNMLGRDTLFGGDALKHRLALHPQPMADKYCRPNDVLGHLLQIMYLYPTYFLQQDLLESRLQFLSYVYLLY
jgi:hypothetical protein